VGGIHGGILVLAAAAVLLFAVDRGLRWGYELRVAGDAPGAAIYGGISPVRTILIGLMVAGAFAGLAGAIEVSASTGRLQAGLSPGYGFMAILVAWLAAGNPVGIALAAILYAGLQNGGFALQVAGIPPAITVVLQAVLLLATLAVVGLGRYRVKLYRPGGALG
jgi:simple sugar transport system permease protein